MGRVSRSFRARQRRPIGAGSGGGLGLIYSHNFEDGQFPQQGAVIPSPLSTDITVSTTNPISGSRSLNFFFVGKLLGNSNWQEHNVALPKCYGGFGMEFDIRFSSNYRLRAGPSGENNTTKWFQFWQQTDANAALDPRVSTDYTSGIFSTGASIRRNGIGNQIELMAVVTSPTGGAASNIGYALLMDPDTPANGPIKPGQIHNIKWRVRYASAQGAQDGFYELLVDNAVVYASPQFAFYPPDGFGPPTPFVSWGYLMGFSNNGFGVDTNVQWDNLKLYNQSTGWW